MMNGPVIVEDLQNETRFQGSSFLHDHHIISSLSLPIASRGRSIGVLGVHSNKPHNFSSDDVEFLESVSNLIAVAIERRRAEEALEEYALRDPLTGLYNRRTFSNRIQDEILRANRKRLPLAILICDLDHFKAINDTMGHQVGDNVLRKVAKSIQESTRGTDLVFRWGGDEFVIVLPEATREGILSAADRIRTGISRIGNKPNSTLDLSIGVALYPEHGRDPDELISHADRALYIAKKGGGKIHIGEEEYHLDEDSVAVVFQPIVNIRSHQIFGYEALSRDPHKKVSILELFKKYHAIGQINELKRLCFRKQLKTAEEKNLKKVFLNVDFNLLDQLDPLPKPPNTDVILEISELEALDEVEDPLRITRKWRKNGYKLALDDFGTGYISLPFLARLGPEHIKVSRSTVLQAVSSEKFKKFMIGIISGLRNYSAGGVIAEGVETSKELRVVKDIGIHLVQGFLLGKPKEIK